MVLTLITMNYLQGNVNSNIFHAQTAILSNFITRDITQREYLSYKMYEFITLK